MVYKGELKKKKRYTNIMDQMLKPNTPSLDRLPPQNIEAEQSVLGALMLDKNGVIKVADSLRTDDFYRGSHQAIYDAMLDLFEKHEPIDILSVSNRLQEKGRLEDVGGYSYLTTLANGVPTSAHIHYYAKIVQQKSTLRKLIDAASQITGLGYAESEDIEKVLDNAEKKIFTVSQKFLKQDFIPIKNTLEEAFERIDRIHKEEGGLRGISTGFYELDNQLAGLQKSNLVILAARPSLGKTSLALDIARSVAVKSKVPVGIFSLEMSREEVVDRLLCAEAMVGLWEMRTGRLSSEGENDDFTRIAIAMDTLSKAPVFIDDSSSSNVMQMRAMARRLQSEHGLGLIVVDYLQLMESTNNRESVVQQISEISRSLKGLARELNVPVLALSQLSRAVESRPDQRPKLSDLRDSGSIEQDADVVMFIYREDKTKPNMEKNNMANILIAKHRNGPIGQVDLYFNEKWASFRNLEKNFQ